MRGVLVFGPVICIYSFFPCTLPNFRNAPYQQSVIMTKKPQLYIKLWSLLALLPSSELSLSRPLPLSLRSNVERSTSLLWYLFNPPVTLGWPSWCFSSTTFNVTMTTQTPNAKYIIVNPLVESTLMGMIRQV